MKTMRPIHAVRRAVPTMEGAGVRLKRAFAQADPALDPFLLLDDFHSDDPSDYIAGFPWHPHRGIETITYVLLGEIAHGDSMGNKGMIGPGDVQWMTAGSGIVHEEMPHQGDGMLWGFQLWANLPAADKMMAPRYREVTAAEIPEVHLNDARVKVICGAVGDTQGPVRDIVTDPTYLDVTVHPGRTFSYAVPSTHNCFAYVVVGDGRFGDERGTTVGGEHLVVFGKGDAVQVTGGEGGLRMLFCAGKPIGEPVAWRGPIVMNSEKELHTAFAEFRDGTFIKHK